MTDDERTRISVYPVGVLSCLLQAVRALRHGRPDLARQQVRIEARYLRGQTQRKNWRAVRQSFNGYLAEIDYPPTGLNFTRCGTGWTRRRAVRSLGQRLAEDNR
jgi:hypothetical protein